MNKYKLLLMICKKNEKNELRTEEVFVETDLELQLTPNLLTTEEKYWSGNLKKILDRLDVKIGLNENLCNIAVYPIKEQKFQKIVFGEKSKKFRKCVAFQISQNEYAICNFDGKEYYYDEKNKILKMIQSKKDLPPIINFKSCGMFEMNTIPEDVTYID